MTQSHFIDIVNKTQIAMTLRSILCRFRTARDSRITEPLGTAFWLYLVSTALVLTGAAFGSNFLERQFHPRQNEPGVIRSLTNWDGVWYEDIVTNGYSYSPKKQSNVAFFPAYPVAATFLYKGFGIPAHVSLLIVSHVSLIFAFVTLAVLCKHRKESASHVDWQWCLLLAVFWPTSVFWRAAYTESMFLATLGVLLLAIELKWPSITIAIVAGFASCCRPVGLAAAPVCLVYLWMQSSTWRQFARHALLVGPVSLWGIATYMAYLWISFGSATAFMQTQIHWAGRSELAGSERLAYSVALLPIVDKFDPGSSAYWRNGDPGVPAPFSLEAANSIYFLAAGFLVLWGVSRGKLQIYDLTLSIGLLAIPYMSHGYRAGMLAQGRYSSVVIPAFIAGGHILARLPPVVSTSLIVVSGAMLFIYSALFSAWYRIF